MPTVYLSPAFVSGAAIGGSISTSGGTAMLVTDDGDTSFLWVDCQRNLGYRINLEFPATTIPGSVASVVLETDWRATEATHFAVGLTGTPFAEAWFNDKDGNPVTIPAGSVSPSSYGVQSVDLTPYVSKAQLESGGLYGTSGYFTYAGGPGSVAYGHVFTYSRLVVTTTASIPPRRIFQRKDGATHGGRSLFSDGPVPRRLEQRPL